MQRGTAAARTVAALSGAASDSLVVADSADVVSGVSCAQEAKIWRFEPVSAHGFKDQVSAS